MTHKIQLGVCCIINKLRNQKPPIFSSRKMIIRSVKEKGIDALKEKILQNLRDTLVMLDWLKDNNLNVFRLSSELFPHKTNPKVEDYTYDFAKDLLKQIGQKAKDYNIRLTFHPGHFNVVASPNEEYFQHTIEDLSYHADVLDLMGCGKDSVMVIHGGGVYGDKEATKKRWCERFQRLPENVRSRLVLENCEKNFSIQDCLDVSKETGIPVVFDTHHYTCYSLLHPDETQKPEDYYMPLVLDTWKKRNIKPKFHISEQGSGKIGHHSNFVEVIPDYLLEIPKKFNISIDIMIEAKNKEEAVLYLYDKYPKLIN